MRAGIGLGNVDKSTLYQCFCKIAKNEIAKMREDLRKKRSNTYTYTGFSADMPQTTLYPPFARVAGCTLPTTRNRTQCEGSRLHMNALYIYRHMSKIANRLNAVADNVQIPSIAISIIIAINLDQLEGKCEPS